MMMGHVARGTALYTTVSCRAVPSPIKTKTLFVSSSQVLHPKILQYSPILGRNQRRISSPVTVSDSCRIGGCKA